MIKMLAPNKTKQTKGATKGGVFDSVLSTDLIEELNNKRDKIFLSAGAHVKQKDEMIAFCNELTAMAKKHVEEGLPWTEQVITEVCDYSQNLGILHFGSEKTRRHVLLFTFGCFHLWNGSSLSQNRRFSCAILLQRGW